MGAPNKSTPSLLPVAANDYITGYLGAYGALFALARRAKEGGSYHVRVSLCQTAMMIYRNGKIQNGLAPDELSLREIDLSIFSRTHLGEAKHLAPVLNFIETSPFWEMPTPKLGGDKAEWLETPTKIYEVVAFCSHFSPGIKPGLKLSKSRESGRKPS